ncbi:hypothetical protein PQI23_11265 [Leucobacter sp. USCH14]|uniref:hypothetical protein n=1 Tax=Leucobacter sp. USCH14 TaxID=3024838 RepID=UPI0030AF135F
MSFAAPDDAIAAILALNSPQVPFAFAPTSTGVTGVWNYADAQWAGVLAAGAVDRTFALDVVLSPDGTYTMTDHSTQMNVQAGAGGGSFSYTKFSGRIRSSSFDSSAAPIARDHGEVGHTFGWRFDSEEMRRPVEQTLQQLGWKKRGFWARLFGG